MTGDYPKKYWWLILIVIPVVLAVIQVYPSLRPHDGSGSGNGTAPPEPSVKEIDVLPSRISLQTGDTTALRAELRDAQGKPLSNQSVSWKSGNEAIASVSGSGKVMARSKGVTVISAESQGIIATTEVVVTPVPLAQIRLLPEKYSILSGDSFPLKAELLDKKGALVDRPLKWHSEDTDVAYVTSTGVVKGMGFGITEIVAESDGVKGCAKIFIGNPKTKMYPVEIQSAAKSSVCR